jgi:hypothetical protein
MACTTARPDPNDIASGCTEGRRRFAGCTCPYGCYGLWLMAYGLWPVEKEKPKSKSEFPPPQTRPTPASATARFRLRRTPPGPKQSLWLANRSSVPPPPPPTPPKEEDGRHESEAEAETKEEDESEDGVVTERTGMWLAGVAQVSTTSPGSQARGAWADGASDAARGFGPDGVGRGPLARPIRARSLAKSATPHQKTTPCIRT